MMPNTAYAAGRGATVVPKGASVPAPWSSQDVGSTGLAGAGWFANGQFVVAGAGSDIAGTADAFQSVSRLVHGDAQIVARITSVSSTNPFAKAGLMFRDTPAAESANVLLDVRPNGSIEFMSRPATGATTTLVAVGMQQTPVWLRLTRRGATFTGEISQNGSAWTVIGSTNAALAVNASAGLVVTSHNVAALGSGTFDNVAVGHPPSAPGSPTPENAAIGIGQNPPLTWSAEGATRYDVRFGITNPPPAAATDLTSAVFVPPALAQGSSYYWQVVARNGLGSTPGPVWSFTTAPASGPATDTILSSADAPDTRLWPRGAETTISRAQMIADARARSKTAAPSASPSPSPSPTNYFPFAPAPAPAATTPPGEPTKRAAASSKSKGTAPTSKANDPLVTQVSNPIKSNRASVAATGTTLSTPSPQDSVATDPVVLGPGADLTIKPAYDTTIAPQPRVTPAASLVSYGAITDRNAYAKPRLPFVGAAGFRFADPTFGSNMLRVTDDRTRPGRLSRSFRVPSNAHLSAWNSNSTAFYVISNDGTVIPYSFNAATMTASRIQATATGDGGLTLGFYVEPQFSLVNPNVIYGAVSGGNNRTISQYNFQTGTYTRLIDLDTIVGGLTGTYVGGVMSGGTLAEKFITFFGGGGQDQHFYALWAPVGNVAARKLLNTAASTINGNPTGTPLNFRLHSAQIDRSGRFVFLYPTSVDLGSPRYASQVYIWDTSSDTVTAITSGGRDGSASMRPYGHDAAGYGTWVNMDCCTSSTWDAAQWQFRSLTSLTQMSDLIAPVPAIKEIYLADHTTWNNAQPNALMPVISSTYRFGDNTGDNTAPWRAWDDEIIAIDTANGGGGNVWRFAHHRSDVTSDTNPGGLYFWYEPIANVSPDGRWVIFTTNWEKTLGMDSAEGTFRQDVFLVQLLVRP
jgi:hypothetical protein